MKIKGSADKAVERTKFPVEAKCDCGVTLEVDKADLAMSRHSGAFATCPKCSRPVLVAVDSVTSVELPKA